MSRAMPSGTPGKSRSAATAPERDRERQPDDQQSRDGCRILAQRSGSDGGRVSEQEQGQRRLGEHLDRFGLGLERDRSKDVIGQKEADGHEGEGRSDRQSVEAGRDQRVAGDQQRKDRQLDLHRVASGGSGSAGRAAAFQGLCEITPGDLMIGMAGRFDLVGHPGRGPCRTSMLTGSPSLDRSVPALVAGRYRS